jgi:hypothetical protein
VLPKGDARVVASLVASAPPDGFLITHSSPLGLSKQQQEEEGKNFSSAPQPPNSGGSGNR